jgi:hypothetical protein
MALLLLKLHGSTPNYNLELSSSGAAFKLLLENNSSRLGLLSNSGDIQQQLLDVAQTTLQSRGLHATRVLG